MALAPVKRALIGPPLPTARLVHERLNKIQGLAVFSSDNLSSSAYATEEILLALTAAGVGAVSLAWPVALAITAVFAIVGFSYYQTIHAYPSGGGAYIVARSNLGVWPGLTAAAALLIDYILTVSVSVAAGIAAITSAVPALFPQRVAMSLAAVGIIVLVNLRGVRESGTVFSIPTYFFVAMMFTMLGLGLFKSLGSPPIPPTLPVGSAEALQPLTLLLILRAFASGSAAMTGVEAMSNGVQAFRPPESRNAGTTLIWMVAILSGMFLGITWLAGHLGVVPAEHETVVSQLARSVFGSGHPAYYLMQAGTAMILILAANTSFADFPRLSSILARDRFLPHQLANLGDRLVYANGIFVLAMLSGLLLVLFKASTHALIPLYAVGVFLSFTLSQAGMVKKWWSARGPGWQRSIVFNAVGTVTTAVILIVVLVAKFRHGAWIIAVLVPSFIWLMRSIWLHYEDVRRQLTLNGAQVPRALQQHKVVVPIGGIHRGVLLALRYARSISDDVTAVIAEVDPREVEDVKAKWDTWGLGIPLKVLPSEYRSVTGPLLKYLDHLEWKVGFDQQLTIILPEFVPARWWHFFLHNQNALLLKLALYFRRRRDHRVPVVTDVPYYLSDADDVNRYPTGMKRSSPLGAGLLLALVVTAGGGAIMLLSQLRGWPVIVTEAAGLVGLAGIIALAALASLRSFIKG